MYLLKIVKPYRLLDGWILVMGDFGLNGILDKKKKKKRIEAKQGQKNNTNWAK